MKIGILKNYLKIGVYKIKFENWNLEKKKLKMNFFFKKKLNLKIKFENWNFGKLFENGIF